MRLLLDSFRSVHWKRVVWIGVCWFMVVNWPTEGTDRMQLAVRARPHVLLWGGDVWVECRVPRIRTYEWVTWGIDGPGYYRASTEAYDGKVIYTSPRPYRLPQTACGTYYAFCVVQQGDELGAVAAPPVAIEARGIGCEVEQP